MFTTEAGRDLSMHATNATDDKLAEKPGESILSSRLACAISVSTSGSAELSSSL